MSCCNIRYEAFDGKIFDNENDCIRYNNAPRIWYVVEILHTIKTIKNVFLTKYEAEQHAKILNERKHGSYFSEVYYVEHQEVSLPKETIHESITNKPSKNKWWSMIKGAVK